jgi:hypothetical protein
MALLRDGLGMAHGRLNNGHMLKLNEPMLTSISVRTIILPHMKKVVCILAVTLGRRIGCAAHSFRGAIYTHLMVLGVMYSLWLNSHDGTSRFAQCAREGA